MRSWQRPSLAPSKPSDANSMAVQVTEYRKALITRGVPEELADRLTIEFQNQILSLASSVVGLTTGIQTK